MKKIRMLLQLLRYGAELGLWSIEAGFWLLHGLRELSVAGLDAASARRSLHAGVLHCPRGHEVPTEGGVYACEACGFTYSGSIWVCGNPECRAISTYADCPTCGESTRNPYRWGRPPRREHARRPS